MVHTVDSLPHYWYNNSVDWRLRFTSTMVPTVRGTGSSHCAALSPESVLKKIQDSDIAAFDKVQALNNLRALVCFCSFGDTPKPLNLQTTVESFSHRVDHIGHFVLKDEIGMKKVSSGDTVLDISPALLTSRAPKLGARFMGSTTELNLSAEVTADVLTLFVSLIYSPEIEIPLIYAKDLLLFTHNAGADYLVPRCEKVLCQGLRSKDLVPDKALFVFAIDLDLKNLENLCIIHFQKTAFPFQAHEQVPLRVMACALSSLCLKVVNCTEGAPVSCAAAHERYTLAKRAKLRYFEKASLTQLYTFKSTEAFAALDRELRDEVTLWNRFSSYRMIDLLGPPALKFDDLPIPLFNASFWEIGTSSGQIRDGGDIRDFPFNPQVVFLRARHLAQQWIRGGAQEEFFATDLFISLKKWIYTGAQDDNELMIGKMLILYGQFFSRELEQKVTRRSILCLQAVEGLNEGIRILRNLEVLDDLAHVRSYRYVILAALLQVINNEGLREHHQVVSAFLVKHQLFTALEGEEDQVLVEVLAVFKKQLFNGLEAKYLTDRDPEVLRIINPNWLALHDAFQAIEDRPEQLSLPLLMQILEKNNAFRP